MGKLVVERVAQNRPRVVPDWELGREDRHHHREKGENRKREIKEGQTGVMGIKKGRGKKELVVIMTIEREMLIIIEREEVIIGGKKEIIFTTEKKVTSTTVGENNINIGVERKETPAEVKVVIVLTVMIIVVSIVLTVIMINIINMI